MTLPLIPKTRVLIADDHADNILLLMDSIDDDCAVIVAKDGRRAVEKAIALRPDLILLDVMMPGMDGFEACARLKADERTRDIPVIFITARRANLDEEQGLRLGAIDYIRKPINPSVTRARIRAHLRLKRKTDLLEDLARIDGLTEIHNRRGFDEALSAEWGRARRLGRPLSLGMLDVDHFKAYNDHYGHAEGDKCLIAIARVLNGAMRRGSDFVARYGGEELVVLAPDTPLPAALALVEAIRGAVADLALPHATSPIADRVTISAGVASMIPDTDRPAAALVERADHALYRAKAAGRNRVMCDGGPEGASGS